MKGATKLRPLAKALAQFEISIDGTPPRIATARRSPSRRPSISSASELSRRYSLFTVGMACIRVWMEVCMSSIEQADRRAEGERHAAPDGTRKKAGRSSGRQKKAG